MDLAADILQAFEFEVSPGLLVSSAGSPATLTSHLGSVNSTTGAVGNGAQFVIADSDELRHNATGWNDLPLVSNQSWAMECVISDASGTASMQVAGRYGNGQTTRQWSVNVGGGNSGIRYVDLAVLNAGNVLRVIQSSAGSLVFGQFNHVVAAVDTIGGNLTLKLWVNGVLVTNSWASELPNDDNNTWPLQVGKQNVSAGFGGVLDCFRFYKGTTTFTQDNADFLYNGGAYRTYAQIINPPPGSFDVVSPLSGATRVLTETEFEWEAADGASTYDLVVADNAGLTSPIVNVSGLIGLTYQPTIPLPGNTLLYCRVTAVNVNGSTNSNTATFTTVDTREILGVFGMETAAHIFNGLLDKTMSLSCLDFRDSNAYFGTTRGDTNGECLGFEKQGVQKIASSPTCGVFVNNGANRLAYRDERQQSVAVDRQGAYASATTGLKPWLPIGTAIQAVIDNEPGYCPAVPAGAFSPGISIEQPAIDAATSDRGHDAREKIRVYAPYVKGPGQGSRVVHVRGENDGYTVYIPEVTINHAAGSPSVFTLEQGYLGEIGAGVVSVNHTGLQILPFGSNATPSGECLVFSAFFTYPDRTNGYCMGPALLYGGVGLHAKALGMADLQDPYIDAWIMCAVWALEGKRGYLGLRIREGLNDRTAPNNTKDVYRTNLDYIIDRFDTRFAALLAAGKIPATVLGILVICDVVGFRIPSNPSSLDHCYLAAKEKATARGLMVVGDHRWAITQAEATRICTDGSHLNSKEDFERTNIESVSRFFLAARKIAQLRSLAYA